MIILGRTDGKRFARSGSRPSLVFIAAVLDWTLTALTCVLAFSLEVVFHLHGLHVRSSEEGATIPWIFLRFNLEMDTSRGEWRNGTIGADILNNMQMSLLGHGMFRWAWAWQITKLLLQKHWTYSICTSSVSSPASFWLGPVDFQLLVYWMHAYIKRCTCIQRDVHTDL